MHNTVSLSVEQGELRNVIERLHSQDLYEDGVTSQYEAARFKNSDNSVVIYKSGKVVVQGKSIDRLVQLISDLGTPKVQSTSEEGHKKSGSDGSTDWSPRIGSDEVGKGDYFGPMVVASCYVDSTGYRSLKSLGIMDSKKLKDLHILERYSQMRDLVEYEVEVLHPSEYNIQHAQIRNVGIMLARLHNIALKRLVERLDLAHKPIEKIVVDQFSTSKQRLIMELSPEVRHFTIEQFHKGESDISVAAASIIARAYFLKEWELMERRYEMTIPKGASNVINTAKEFVQNFGADELGRVAKISFKTTSYVLGKTL